MFVEPKTSKRDAEGNLIQQRNDDNLPEITLLSALENKILELARSNPEWMADENVKSQIAGLTNGQRMKVDGPEFVIVLFALESVVGMARKTVINRARQRSLRDTLRPNFQVRNPGASKEGVKENTANEKHRYGLRYELILVFISEKISH
jgi:hypothetical protein